MHSMTGNRSARAALAALAAGVALSALLAFVADARRQAGTWGAREFQVQSLSPLSVTYTAAIEGVTGTAWVTSGVLPPYGTTYLQPGISLGVTGTLVLDAGGPAAAAIAHLEAFPDEIGNDVYEMRGDEDARLVAYLPVLARDLGLGGSSSTVIVHHRGAQPLVTATLTLLDDNGNTVGVEGHVFSRLTAFSLVLVPGLPPEWHGAGIIQASDPVLVDVVRTNGLSYESYPGLTMDDAAPELVLPWVAPAIPELITSTVHVFNPNVLGATAVVAFEPGGTFTATLPPYGTAVFAAPPGGAPGSARISGDAGLLALTRMVSGYQDQPGALNLVASAVPRLTFHTAVPLLYWDYDGWFHTQPGAVRLYNASDLTAAITMTYQPADQAGGVIYTAMLAPRSFTDDYPPPAGPAQHWALRVASTQPSTVAVVGYKQGISLDHWFAYRGRAYVPPEFRVYLPVSLANSSWRGAP